VYFILTVFVLVWAKLPDINKWMDGWIAQQNDCLINLRICKHVK